jgi:hypothetical protein
MMYKLPMAVTKDDYKNTLEKAKAELIANQQRLGTLLQEQEEVEDYNVRLREVIVTLSRLLGEQFVEEDALGLTDAIKQAFKSSSVPLHPTQVRDVLKSMGIDITKYGNVMASVHSVINRLNTRGDITGCIVGGKPAFQWNPVRRMTPPPTYGAPNSLASQTADGRLIESLDVRKK